jgi:CubicO group peptidase (beta-lactamase class C family)
MNSGAGVRILIFSLIAFCFSPAFAAEAVEAPAGPMYEVDALFADYDNDHSPGCALGVIRDGEFAYRRGYGMANLELDVPISSHSVFRIGSTSKQFTAMAVALLAEEGKLALDDTLKEYYLAYPAWADDITIAQMIHHTSGLRDYLTLAELAGRGDDQDNYTTDWVIKMLARQRETNFPPGTQYLYSNSGYLMLGQIVERVSGQTLREFSQERIFGPLGMTHSHFHDDHTHIVPQRASGYAPTADGYRISMTTLDMVGDGGVFTTIDDLLLWDRNFYENRLGAGKPALIAEITTPGTLANGEPIEYAFGLIRETYRGQTLISHGGSFVGFRAELIRFPALRFSVAVLCNRSDAAPWTLARKVADRFLADDLEPLPEETFQPEIVELDEEQLDKYVGDFWEPTEAFAAEVAVEDDKLWAVHSPERRNELVAIGENRFRMIGLPAEVIVEYELSGEGVESMRRFINGEARGSFTPFDRRIATAEELAEYRADYFSPELDVDYLIRVSGDHLLLHVDDGKTYDLTPMFDDTFENPDLGAFEFLRGTNGKVSGLKVQSGRVRNLMFYRRL